MGQNVQIGELADAIMETLEEYADLAADNVKQAVKDAGETVKKEICANAPKDTGDDDGLFPESLLPGPFAGIWPCQKKWRPGRWKEPYCSGRRKGNPAVGGRG